MSNRLAGETSPYLLQHKDNPVDWHPWGAEALAKAKAEEKPIFLSIGYAACHWCHVMEHESFENDAIAAILNEKFVSVKVDREERPDLDQIYMTAVQVLNRGQGGWPMSVFLTPEGKPFFAGTYFPPTSARGMPGFDQVLTAVADAWESRREMAVEQAGQVAEMIRSAAVEGGSETELDENLFAVAVTQLERVFDYTHGGLGRAPKFPHAMDVQLLLRIWRRTGYSTPLEMATLTLDKMARGGIYDHLAGGFARYSVDERWLVPHFEKMLYDNALLAGAYLDGFLATREPRYGRVCRETLDYVLTYMADAAGGFHSTEDADSEGEEGKFYVWTPGEVKELLSEAAGERFCYVYDVSEEGNFEEKNILNLPKTIEQCASLKGWDAESLAGELKESRELLLAARDRRVRPGKDDKVLVSWNALMIDALARAAGVFDEPQYLAAAARGAEFLLAHLRREDGRLLHSWREGRARFDAYLDDYSYLASALVTLYEATFDEKWIDEGVRLAETMLEHFADAEGGGFFFTADDHEELIARTKDLHDSSVPSGNGMAATALIRLARLTGRDDFEQAARRALEAALPVLQRSGTAAGQHLLALDLLLGPLPEIAILGDIAGGDTLAVVSTIRKSWLPAKVVALRREAKPEGSSPHLDALFAGKEAPAAPTVYVCERFTCRAPASGKQAALEAVEELAAHQGK